MQQEASGLRNTWLKKIMNMFESIYLVRTFSLCVCVTRSEPDSLMIVPHSELSITLHTLFIPKPSHHKPWNSPCALSFSWRLDALNPSSSHRNQRHLVWDSSTNGTSVSLHDPWPECVLVGESCTPFASLRVHTFVLFRHGEGRVER